MRLGRTTAAGRRTLRPDPVVDISKIVKYVDNMGAGS